LWNQIVSREKKSRLSLKKDIEDTVA